MSEKGVLLLPRPSSLNAHPTLAGRLPAGRQCHHSAASSSARLNTGAKVHTAAALGEVHTHTHMQEYALGRKKINKNHKLHRMHMFPSLTLAHSVSLSLTHKAAVGGQRSRGHRAEPGPRSWLVWRCSSNFINPEVNEFWTLAFAHLLPLNHTLSRGEVRDRPSQDSVCVRVCVFTHTHCFWPTAPHMMALCDNLISQGCGNY